ncbi:MAG: glycosyltransferase [Acidiferrobacterales bacterium]
MHDRQPRRILHTIDTTGPGGAETVFVELATRPMGPAGENIVAITGPGWVDDELRRRGMSAHVLSESGSFDARYLYGLVRLIRRHRVDLVQSHLLGSNVYCSLAGMICRVPVVSTFHGSVDFGSSERNLALKRFALNSGSSRCVFVSDSLREEVVARCGISRRKAITIHNGIDAAAFTPNRNRLLKQELGLADNAIIVGAVGNIRPSKDYDTLLRAAALIRAGNPRYQFIVVGEGNGGLAGRLLQLRRELGLDDAVHFIGFRQDIAALLNSFDVFMLSSISEGFSLATVQAMACGVPVVATRSGGPEEIISDGVNGILVDIQSETQLAGAIRHVAENVVIQKSLASSALELARSRYTLDAMLVRYHTLYEELISRSSGSYEKIS